MRLRTVGEFAGLTGITVRTLHHYDEIGLLEPSERTAAGYRLYSDADLIRLHSILNWRDLGFGLSEISRMLDDAGQDLATGLKRQRERLAERSDRLHEMIAALDAAIAALDRGDTMTDDHVMKAFGGFDPSRYEDEVEDRWGDTDSYAESRRRIGSYTEDDWRRQRQETDDNVTSFAGLLRAGVPPTDQQAIEAAREHGAIIDRWFYPLSPEAHLGLARMYVIDPRFEAVYEKAETGLARYISDAIDALHAD
jgi:DNA-binding transcriptional MerR regulator